MNTTSSSNTLYKWLTAMSSLAVLTPITGDSKWLTFLCFLAFFALIKVNYDERMINNINKANRNGYYASILSLAVVLAFSSGSPTVDGLILAIQAAIIFSSLIVAVSFTLYERFGE